MDRACAFQKGKRGILVSAWVRAEKRRAIANMLALNEQGESALCSISCTVERHTEALRVCEIIHIYCKTRYRNLHVDCRLV